MKLMRIAIDATKVKVYKMAGLKDAILHVFEGALISSNPNVYRYSNDSCCGSVNAAKENHIEFKEKEIKDTLVACINSTKPVCARCEEYLFKKYQVKKGVRGS